MGGVVTSRVRGILAPIDFSATVEDELSKEILEG
jgi:hypothetical protein